MPNVFTYHRIFLLFLVFIKISVKDGYTDIEKHNHPSPFCNEQGFLKHVHLSTIYTNFPFYCVLFTMDYLLQLGNEPYIFHLIYCFWNWLVSTRKYVFGYIEYGNVIWQAPYLYPQLGLSYYLLLCKGLHLY